MSHWILSQRDMLIKTWRIWRQKPTESRLSWQASFYQDQGICRVVWRLKD